jgi:hypothetical protein
MNLLEYLELQASADNLTKSQFAEIRSSGDVKALEAAVEIMNDLGGYECMLD